MRERPLAMVRVSTKQGVYFLFPVREDTNRGVGVCCLQANFENHNLPSRCP